MRTIGLEIEFKKTNSYKESVVEKYIAGSNMWSLVLDNTCGHELISKPIDMETTDTVIELYNCFNFLKYLESDRQIEFNKDCGLHIHYDVYDLDIHSIKQCVGLWLENERTLMEMVDPCRINSQWCLPHYKDIEYIKEKDHESVKSLADHLQKGDRGYAINLYSYFKYKTIEIRLHEATASFKKFLSWLNILIDLKIIPII